LAVNNVAVIGAGLMGAGVARTILKGGFNVAVFDLDGEAVAAIERDGARAAVSAADASRDADIVITVLPAPPHVEAAVFGEDGVAETIGEGAILIQQSTVDPAAVKDLARRLGLQGVQVLDAPMLRNPAAAAAGTLGFVVGGDEAAFARAMPIFDCMGESAEHVGPVGTG
jgi:3-hydroxyisobutyrate dehydrogenase-like beta-hydroxyacid dehydrogenase